jgi:hypothetical protein
MLPSFLFMKNKKWKLRHNKMLLNIYSFVSNLNWELPMMEDAKWFRKHNSVNKQPRESVWRPSRFLSIDSWLEQIALKISPCAIDMVAIRRWTVVPPSDTRLLISAIGSGRKEQMGTCDLLIMQLTNGSSCFAYRSPSGSEHFGSTARTSCGNWVMSLPIQAHPFLGRLRRLTYCTFVLVERGATRSQS